MLLLVCLPRLLISIHAPLRERPPAKCLKRHTYRFQSTLPYGSDTISSQVTLRSSNFNPRSLTGATILWGKFACLIIISIHAPLRERLPPILTGVLAIGISIHAPLRERQWVNLCGEQQNPISIHAPLRERL